MNANQKALKEDYDWTDAENLAQDIKALGELQYAYIRLLCSDGIPESASWVGWYINRQMDDLASRADALFKKGWKMHLKERS